MKDLIQIFINPRATFETQKEDSAWLKPALIILATTIVSAIVIPFTMDLGGAIQIQIDQTVEMMKNQGMPQETVDNVAEQMRKQLEDTQASPTMAVLSGIVTAILVFFVLSLLHALYFFIVGKILKTDIDYSDWLALAVWGRMPWAIGAVITILAALVMSPQVDPQAYNLLAFSNFISLPNIDRIFLGSLIKTLDLFVIWSIVIMTIGFACWTERSMGVSVTIVAIPYVIVYGALILIF